MSFRKTILFNASSNWACMIVSAAVALMLVPIVLAKVGVAGYGVWALLVYGLSYIAILDGAFSLAINRFVAFYRNDPEQINSYISVSLLILIILAALILLFVICLSFYITDFFSAIPESLAKEARITFILVGLTVALQIIQGSFSGALRGYEYYTRCNFVIILCTLLRAGLTVCFLSFWTSIIAVQVAYVTAMIMSTFGMYLVARKSIPSMNIRFSSIRKNVVKELTTYTLYAITRSGGTVAMYSTLALFVGWKGTAADMTAYDIGSKLPGFIHQLMIGIQNVFLPSVSSMWAKKQIESIRRVLIRATHFCSVMTLMSAILLFVFAEDILRFWLRSNYTSEMAIVMIIWIIAVIPAGLFEIWLPVLVGMGYNKGLTVRSITTSSFAIILAFVLINGPVATSLAPALALAIAMCIGTGLWLPIYGTKKLEMRPLKYFKEGLSQSLLACILSIVAIWLLFLLMPKEGVHWLVRFILVSGVMVLLFAAFAMRPEITGLIAFLKKKVLRHTC